MPVMHTMTAHDVLADETLTWTATYVARLCAEHGVPQSERDDLEAAARRADGSYTASAVLAWLGY